MARIPLLPGRYFFSDDPQEEIDAYKQALERFGPESAYRGVVQMKLDAAGGDQAKAGAVLSEAQQSKAPAGSGK